MHHFMITVKAVIITLLFFPFILCGQTESIHQYDISHFGKFIHNSQNINSSESIVDLNQNLFDKKTATVFGYLPYWEADNSIINRLRLDLLTYIACFGFEALPNGLGNAPSNWPWTNIFNAAHSNGVKLILSVYSFSSDTIHTILTDTTVQHLLFTDIESQINTFNLDGINIDFENLNDSDEGNNINVFMRKLSEYFHQRFPNFEVSFAAPPINWNNDWDFASLAQSCDYLFLMEYDYFGSWSDVTGPVAPIIGGAFNVNITRSIFQDYSEVINSAPEKLILGMPYYGARWETTNNIEGADVVRFIDSPRYRDAKVFLEGRELLWSAEYQNPWFQWQNTDTTWEQVWFDNDSSLSEKYDLALNNNLKGIGIWALNYDGELPELWDLMERKLVDTTTSVDEKILPAEIKLYQNYPNPFNPSTTIRFSIPARLEDSDIHRNDSRLITLKVFDILGRKIATLVNEKKVPGNYEIKFDAAKLASGIYFYRLSAGNFTSTKKMILLK